MFVALLLLLKEATDMELIFYCADQSDYSSELLKKISVLVPFRSLIKCLNFKTLKCSLLKPEYDLFAAILVISSRQDLLDVQSISDLLLTIRVILIIPDWGQEDILRGHSLRPKLLTSPGRNSNDVIAVLQKMLRNEEK